MPLAQLTFWFVAHLLVAYLPVAYLPVAHLPVAHLPVAHFPVAYLLVTYLLVAYLLGGGASLQLRTWRFIVLDGCLPLGSPFLQALTSVFGVQLSLEVTHGRLPWLPPLFAFCPHLLITCFAVNWHLPSIC